MDLSVAFSSCSECLDSCGDEVFDDVPVYIFLILDEFVHNSLERQAGVEGLVGKRTAVDDDDGEEKKEGYLLHVQVIYMNEMSI